MYSPVIDGVQQRFRLVGARHYNAVIEDEQTGTWWYQASGRAAVGPRAGRQLEALEHEQTTLRAWMEAHPESTVLQPDPSFASDYADIAGYDRRRPPSPEGADPKWSRRSWIVGLVVGDTAKAYPWDDLVSKRAINDAVGGAQVLVTVEEDSMSFHAFRRDIDGETLTFSAEAGGKAMIDDKTGCAGASVESAQRVICRPQAHPRAGLPGVLALLEDLPPEHRDLDRGALSRAASPLHFGETTIALPPSSTPSTHLGGGVRAARYSAFAAEMAACCHRYIQARFPV